MCVFSACSKWKAEFAFNERHRPKKPSWSPSKTQQQPRLTAPRPVVPTSAERCCGQQWSTYWPPLERNTTWQYVGRVPGAGGAFSAYGASVDENTGCWKDPDTYLQNRPRQKVYGRWQQARAASSTPTILSALLEVWSGRAPLWPCVWWRALLEVVHTTDWKHWGNLTTYPLLSCLRTERGARGTFIDMQGYIMLPDHMTFDLFISGHR